MRATVFAPEHRTRLTYEAVAGCISIVVAAVVAVAVVAVAVVAVIVATIVAVIIGL